MATVSPQWDGTRWVVDLRGFGLGQRYRLAGAGGPDAAVEATNAAWVLLRRLERERDLGANPTNSQQTLPGTAPGGGLSGDCLFRFACDEWAPRQQWDTVGGARWGEGYLKLVRRELGHLRIAQFEPPTGDDLLLSYARNLKEKGFAPATRRNRISIAARVLAYCKHRGWLERVPLTPKAAERGERPAVIDFTVYTEAMFRTLRAAVFANANVGAFNRICRTDEERVDYIARRRLYLSFAFYTGMHTEDLDRLTAEAVAVDFASYTRTNTKSARYIAPENFDMPEGLLADCNAEQTRLGREWRPGEKICGGRWGSQGPIACGVATKRLELPPFNFRTTARRSCIWHYALLGWNERDMSEILGHVDQKMIRTVYLRVPTRMRSPAKVPWTIDNVARMPWRIDKPRAVILPFKPALSTGEGEGE